MKKLIFSLLFILSCFISHAQFSNIYSSTTNLRDIFCLNKDTVFACGEGGIVLRTFDGGQSWKRDSLIDANLNSIFMRNNGNGIIVTDYGLIYKTSNFGIDWNFSLPILNSDLGEVKMANDTSYFLLRDYRFSQYDPVKKSGNLLFVCGNKIDTLYAKFSQIGEIGLVNTYCNFGVDSIFLISYNYIYSSFNHGHNWNQKQGYAYSLDMKTSALGFFGSNSYKIYKTNDSFDNNNFYQALTNSPPGYQTQMDNVEFLSVIDDSTTYIAGSSACCGPSYSNIAKTTDAGFNWERRMNDIYPIDLHMINKNIGYLIDKNKKVYKIENGCIYEDCRIVTNIQNKEIDVKNSCIFAPNPFNEKTVLNIEYAIPVLLDLYNTLGEIVESHTISSSQFELYKGNKHAGCYFYKIKSDKNELLQKGKLIIQ